MKLQRQSVGAAVEDKLRAEIVSRLPQRQRCVLRRRQRGVLHVQQGRAGWPTAVIVAVGAPRRAKVQAGLIVFPRGGDRQKRRVLVNLGRRRQAAMVIHDFVNDDLIVEREDV